MSAFSRSTRVGPGIVLSTLALAGRSWAQSPGGSPEEADPARLGGPVILLLILSAGLLLLLGLITKVLDLRLKRDGEVVAVKGVISEALGGDPELFELPLTATVRVPLLSGSPVTIRVFGEVPSDKVEQIVLRRVKRAAAAGLSVRARVKSRIGVSPDAAKASLRTARSG